MPNTESPAKHGMDPIRIGAIALIAILLLLTYAAVQEPPLFSDQARHALGWAVAATVALAIVGSYVGAFVIGQRRRESLIAAEHAPQQTSALHASPWLSIIPVALLVCWVLLFVFRDKRNVVCAGVAVLVLQLWEALYLGYRLRNSRKAFAVWVGVACSWLIAVWIVVLRVSASAR